MSKEILNVVKEKYAGVARSGLSTKDDGVRAVAEAFGYSAAELESIPAGANMGLSCGNPTATASLKPGEVVIDLGSGGGLDVFLASKKVGPAGRAIGVDMTPEMIERARKNTQEGGYTNVEFRLGKIDALPLDAESADCVISNCVINLAPDKRAVFREIYRVLKPGGRVAASDIAIKKQLPAELAADLMAYVGCVAGAISIEEYEEGLRAAGFLHVHVVDAGSDLNAYAKVDGQSGCCPPAKEPKKKSAALATAAEESSCCGGVSCCGAGETATVHGGLSEVLSRYDVNEYAASVKVYAVKAAR